tara:strand:+ start:3280 stop:3963 length:684 start_codon:yes stop_codon:yes gene_type:complete
MPSWLFRCAAAAAIFTTSACSSGPQDPVRDLGEDSSLGALLAQNPEVEAKVIEAMGDGAGMFRSEADRKQYAAHIAGPIVNEFMKPKMDNLNDEMVSRISDVISQRVMETVVSGDDCMRPLRGGDNSLTSGLGEERTKQIFLDIAKMEPDLEARTAPKHLLAVYFLSRSDEIADRAGMDANILREVLNGSRPPTTEEQCRVAAGAMAMFADMPPEEGAPLLRAMQTS